MPGMKTKVIQAVVLGNANDAFPLGGVCRRIPMQGKDAAFQCAAQEECASIDLELFFMEGEVPHAKDHVFVNDEFVCMQLQV